jgi:subtilase-type serine protease
VEGTIQLTSDVTLTPSLRLAWVHEFNPTREISAEFQVAPGFPFTVQGARAAQDSAQVQAGLEMRVAKNFGVFANFDGNLSGAGNSYGGFGGVKVRW